jgi:hypothetical protein
VSLPARLLVVDETLDRRLAEGLRLRGRHAGSAEELGLAGLADPGLLDAVRALGGDPVLLTADDGLPGARDADGLTIAVIDVRTGADAGLGPRREAVHRWAHLIAAQRPGSARRYGVARHGAWRARA